MVAVGQPNVRVGCVIQLPDRVRESVDVLIVGSAPASIIEFISDRFCRSHQRSEAIDLEAEDCPSLRASGVFDGYIRARGVHAHTLYRERLAAGTDIQHRKVKCVRAVEVYGLRAGARGRVALADEVMQTGVVLQTDGVKTRRSLRVSKALSDRLYVSERVVRYCFGACSTQRAAYDCKGVGNLDVAGLDAGLSRCRIVELVDAVLVVVR